MKTQKSTGINILGTALLIIALYPIIKCFYILAVVLQSVAQKDNITLLMAIKNEALAFRLGFSSLFSYSGLQYIFHKPSFHSQFQAKIAYFIITDISFLPIVCSIVFFVSGIGIFLRKNIARICAVIGLSVMLVLGLVNILGNFWSVKRFYIDNILSAVLFSVLLFCLTRTALKKQFT